MDYKTPDEEPNELNEPHASYGASKKMKLRIFKSFEEANEADAKEAALRTPEQRIKDTVELILRVYGVTREEIKARNKKLRINFTNHR